MTYSVVWMPRALQELAAIWLASTNRNAVTRAGHAIDLALSLSPHHVGTLLYDFVYEYSHAPLAVEYEVIDFDMRVFLITVWDTARGRPALTGN